MVTNCAQRMCKNTIWTWFDRNAKQPRRPWTSTPANSMNCKRNWRRSINRFVNSNKLYLITNFKVHRFQTPTGFQLQWFAVGGPWKCQQTLRTIATNWGSFFVKFFQYIGNFQDQKVLYKQLGEEMLNENKEALKKLKGDKGPKQWQIVAGRKKKILFCWHSNIDLSHLIMYKPLICFIFIC